MSAQTIPEGIPCPFDLRVGTMAAFLNCELSDDPHYTGLEVQWFDDAQHGRGLLVFLERREDGRVDYYVTPGLTLDRADYGIGAGIGAWIETTFDAGVLDVGPEGVRCHIAFTDRQGRSVEARIDDRRPGERDTGTLLAPVGAGVLDPQAQLLVHLHGFDLVRRGAEPPVTTIDGRRAATGVLPGRRLHGRELIKYAAPVTVITLNRAEQGPLRRVRDGAGARVDADGLAALHATVDGHRVRLELRPSLPDVTTLPDQHTRTGQWRVLSGEHPPLTGGGWRVHRDGGEAAIEMTVTERWRPGPLPALMRLVTTVVPTFRRWPTTYRWDATVGLDPTPTIRSSWQRTATDGEAYRRATGSAG